MHTRPVTGQHASERAELARAATEAKGKQYNECCLNHQYCKGMASTASLCSPVAAQQHGCKRILDRSASLCMLAGFRLLLIHVHVCNKL